MPLKFKPEYVEYCLRKNISLDDYIKEIEALEFYWKENLEYHRYWAWPMQRELELLDSFIRPSRYKRRNDWDINRS